MILVNDRFMERDDFSVNIEDRGYQFGDGIYEVVRVYNGKPFCLDDHLIRFERSSKEIKLPLPSVKEDIKANILKLIELNNLKEGTVYFQATRGVAARSHQFPTNTASVLVAYTNEVKRPLEKIINGIKVVTVEDIRWLRCDIKSLNLLGNVLAKQYAIENQAGEALQIRDKFVTEGSSSNFYIINNNSIYTHPADNYILRGITRNVIEDLAKKLNIPFIEKKFDLSEVYNAEETFITSTTFEITPVIQIDKQKISDTPGNITRKLQEEFNKLIL